MRTRESMTSLDRPWRRPGAAWYALRRLPGLLRPPVDVYEPTADCLRNRDVPAPPRIRLEVRESRNVVTTVRDEAAWPLARTQWRPLYLTAAGLAAEPPPAAGHLTFDLWAQGARWEWTAGADTEITGPMALRLFVEAHDADDIDLFVGVEKWRGQRYVPFEGSYGFGRDRITTGWLKASLRRLDELGSRPFDPVPTFGQREALRPGQVVQAAR